MRVQTFIANPHITVETRNYIIDDVTIRAKNIMERVYKHNVLDQNSCTNNKHFVMSYRIGLV